MELKIVTKRAPTTSEMADLKFALRVAKRVKSNAIVYAKDGATVGIGAGQMSRVDIVGLPPGKRRMPPSSAHLPETLAKGSVVASDAFFPLPTACLPRLKRAQRRLFNPVARCAMTR